MLAQSLVQHLEPCVLIINILHIVSPLLNLKHNLDLANSNLVNQQFLQPRWVTAEQHSSEMVNGCGAVHVQQRMSSLCSNLHSSRQSNTHETSTILLIELVRSDT